MRSKFLVCAAIAAAGVSVSYVSVAHAAGARDKHDKQDKSAKAKPTELHADDKAIKRQTQWEDKVMGPDSTRKDLEKIARARAVTEKAERDRQEREKQAALEPAPAPRLAPKKNEKSELSLLTSPAGDKNDAKAHEISPQLATAAAQKAPAPVKAADDKFIDKLLREEDAPSKKRASVTEKSTDKELDNLLAGAKESKGRKRGDSVDDLLKTADKGPAMPAPRAQSGGLPEWAKQPEIAPTPAPPPPPVAVKPAAKNDGVIHVVQGAAGNAPAVVAPSRPAAVATRGGRKPAAKAPVSWNDPFAEKKPMADASSNSTNSMKKTAASHPSASSDSSWNDPFAEPAGDTRKSVRRTSTPAAPASTSAPKRTGGDKSEPSTHPAGWKDPFTKAPSEPTRAPVAMRELAKSASAPVAMRELGKSESSKWEIAARRPAAHASASDAHPSGGWSVIKKRAR